MGVEQCWQVFVASAALLWVAVLVRVSLGTESLVHGRLGGTVELRCSLDPPSISGHSPHIFPLHVVEWVRLGYSVPILIQFGVYTPRVHPAYRGRVSLSDGAALHLEALRLEDEGWFECRILLLDRSPDEFHNGTWTFLSIRAPPVFMKIPPPFLEILKGDWMDLTCSGHGNPQPTVSWLKDGSQAEKIDGMQVSNGTLTLASVTREMAGLYTCQVANTEGNLTYTTQLKVKGPPIIIIPPEDTTLNMSQDGVLHCQADAYPANLSYMWWKEGENVHHVDSLKSRVKVLVDGTLLIPSLLPEDSGNYTCTPTNGILTPPSASAYLTVKHPAQVVRMPRETYLPTGMGGVIACPVRAEPPVLYINWTKDGDVLDLDLLPGWMMNSEGSVFIASANDDAIGMYTCTAYNSYGTMGESEPTTVVLQDPPSFKVSPRVEYLQEIGRDLVVPCQALGDPSPNITWVKIGPTPRVSYSIAANGSLILHPVRKEHQGSWECRATNRVATVSASTMILVLGTSPHAVSTVSISAGVDQANVSWVPGFDGGYTQRFSVWVKRASRGRHEWASLPVPSSQSSLLVTGLVPATGYQFSILPQNKLGSGPFSEITTVRTQVPITEPPPAVTAAPKPAPPLLLAVNHTLKGIVLQWVSPQPQSPPITGYMLQARRERGEWQILNGSISPSERETLVQGILKDCIYELRLLSLRNHLVSQPSESLNVSTAGMDAYPSKMSLLEYIPEPLFAGVVGGVCFLFIGIILSLVTACIMSHRRSHRRWKRRHDIPTVLQKSPPPATGSSTDSPDSIMKLKLCPPISFFPGSSSQSDRSSFDKGSRSEYQEQRQQLLSTSSPPPRYALFESHLGGLPSPPSVLESISRGPDGRFIVQPYEEGSTPSHIKKNLMKSFPQCTEGENVSVSCRTSYSGSPKSDSLQSEKDEKKSMSMVLAADLHGLRKAEISPGRVKTMAKNFSRHGCFHSDYEHGCSEGLLEQESIGSDCSEKITHDSLKKYRVCSNQEPRFCSLRKKTMEAERELKMFSYLPMRESQIIKNSNIMEEGNNQQHFRVLQEQYASNQNPTEAVQEDEKVELQQEEPVWKPQDITLRPKAHRASGQVQRPHDQRRGCYFGNASSPMERISTSSSYIHWDISPVTSLTSLVPVQNPSVLQPLASPMQGAAMGDMYCSHSPVTQCTSLSLLSPSVTSSVLSPGDLKAKSRFPGKGIEGKAENFNREYVAGEHRAKNVYKDIPPGCEFQIYKLGHVVDSKSNPKDQRVSFRPPRHHFDLRVSEQPQRTSLVHLHSEHDCSKSSTLPFRLQKTGTSELVTKTCDEPQCSLISPECEKEGVRSRSRKSDRCQYSDGPSRVSLLTFQENSGTSDPSHFSVPRVSDSSTTELVTHVSKTSLLQTSTILEYLSLPGFIEMSVDDPVEGGDGSDSLGVDSFLRGEPDVVPKDWDVPSTSQNQKCAVILENKPPSETEDQLSAQDRESWTNEQSCSSCLLADGCSDEMHQISFEQALYPEAWKDDARVGTQEPPAQPHERLKPSFSSGVYRAPIPYMKRSVSMGQNRGLPTGGACSLIKKSISLGSQRWQPCESSKSTGSDACYPNKFAKPEKGQSTSPFYINPSQNCTFFQPQSIPNFENVTHIRLSSAGPRSMPSQTSTAGWKVPSQQRHTAAYPESSLWKEAYSEVQRSSRPLPRSADLFKLHIPSLDKRRVQQPRSYRPMPRGYSWPSPFQSVVFPREPKAVKKHGEVETVDNKDTTEERTSYASQSSGRGSLGAPYNHSALRHSLSLTPTLPSSPETTEDSTRHARHGGLTVDRCGRTAKRRNTSVDESYEWDSAECLPEFTTLEAARLDTSHEGRVRWEGQRERPRSAAGLWEVQRQVSPSQDPYSHSLSEARFNALRLEYQEYRRTRESSHSCDPDPSHEPDCKTVLL